MGSDSTGRASDAFDHFKLFVVRGFLAARRRRERLLTRVAVGLDQDGGRRCVCVRLQRLLL